MAERKPRFRTDDRFIVDMESLKRAAYGETVALAIDDVWARIIVDALNRTTQ